MGNGGYLSGWHNNGDDVPDWPELDPEPEAEPAEQLARNTLLKFLVGGPTDFWDQTAVWRDIDGNVWLITDLETSHLRNIMRFLLERAQSYKHLEEAQMARFGDLVHGEAAGDSFDSEFERFLEMRPVEWLRHTPLFMALHRESRQRPHRQHIKWNGTLPDTIDMSRF